MDRKQKHIFLIVSITLCSLIGIIGGVSAVITAKKNEEANNLIILQFLLTAPAKFKIEIYAVGSWEGSCSLGFSGTGGSGSHVFDGREIICRWSFTLTEPSVSRAFELTVSCNGHEIFHEITYFQGKTFSGSHISPTLSIDLLFFSETIDRYLSPGSVVVGTIIALIIIIILLSVIYLVIEKDLVNKIRHQKSYFKYKHASLGSIKTKKTISKLICPACKAPLIREPPCKCEYCGTNLRHL